MGIYHFYAVKSSFLCRSLFKKIQANSGYAADEAAAARNPDEAESINGISQLEQQPNIHALTVLKALSHRK